MDTNIPEPPKFTNLVQILQSGIFGAPVGKNIFAIEGLPLLKCTSIRSDYQVPD